MKIGAFDDVVAVEKRAPREDQQILETGVEEDVIQRLGIARLSEKGAEAHDPGGVEATRELPDGILLEQGSRFSRRCDPSDKGRPEDRPPELVVAGLVDEDVILAWKEPGQRALRELVATLAQQVGRGAADDEVDLDLGVAVGARSYVSGHVSNHSPIDAVPKPEVIQHRKKR